jgi:PST family polysaccharide transporter
VLALRGGAELVALWAQLSTAMELVTGVVGAGVGTGLVVYAARTSRPERQRDLLREALKLGMATTLPVAVAIAAIGALFPDLLTGGKLAGGLIALGAACGWIGVIPVLINNLWLGQQRRELMLGFALGTAALALAVAALAPPDLLLPMLVVSQAIPAGMIFLMKKTEKRPRFRARSHPLRRYIAPGFAVGILGAASTLAARSMVGEALSWHEAGVLQALWRVSDWVGAFAGGVLSVYFLPRFAAARGTPLLAVEIRKAASWILLPSAAIFAVLFLAHRALLPALYDATFAASDAAAAWLFAGSAARVASWIPLFALFAMRRTRAITFGELLSLPLFALLLFLGRESLSLEQVGMYWLAAYAAYFTFNLWAMRR